MSNDYSYNNRNLDSNYRNPTGETSTSALTTPIALTFINRVYAWMFVGLLVTGVLAFYLAQTGIAEDVAQSRSIFYGSAIVQLILVVMISAMTEKLSAFAAGALFLVYSALNGVTFSILFLLYTQASIASTFFITAGAFAGLSVVGMFIKKDLSVVGTFCIFALIGLIIASVVNIFMQSTGLYWALTYGGILIFAGLTAYDTQKLKQMNEMFAGDTDSREVKRFAINGALTLYLDFVNLFLLLLRLFGNRK